MKVNLLHTTTIYKYLKNKYLTVVGYIYLQPTTNLLQPATNDTYYMPTTKTLLKISTLTPVVCSRFTSHFMKYVQIH